MKNILFVLLSLFAFNSTTYAKAFDLIVTPSKEEPKEISTPTSQLNGKKLLIMISSDQLEQAGMGLALGLSAAKKGIKVTYVIGAKALNSAKISGKQNLFLAKQMTHRAILQEAMAHGASVHINYICAEALGLSEKDFIEGATIVKSKVILNAMFTEDTKVLSF